MKLQIVSKLVRKNSQTKENSLSYSILPINGYNQQYYPQKYLNKQKATISKMTNKRDQFVDFFEQFQQVCTVIYTKRVNKEDSIRKKLQPQLARLQRIDVSSSKNSQIEFSFKKENKSEYNDKNTTLQTQASETITRSRESYTRASTKGKLRKFNSLLTLKGQPQQNNISYIRPLAIKNSSVYRQSYFNQVKVEKDVSFIPSNRLSYNPTTSRIKIQNIETKSPLLNLNQNNIKTQRCGEDIKERLSRIRKELNMIYEEKKQPHFKLKLF